MFKPVVRRNKNLVKYSESILEQEVQLLEKGCTYEDISKALDIPMATICYHINKRMRYKHPELFNRVMKVYENRTDKRGHKIMGYRRA